MFGLFSNKAMEGCQKWLRDNGRDERLAPLLMAWKYGAATVGIELNSRDKMRQMGYTKSDLRQLPHFDFIDDKGKAHRMYQVTSAPSSPSPLLLTPKRWSQRWDVPLGWVFEQLKNGNLESKKAFGNWRVVDSHKNHDFTKKMKKFVTENGEI